MLESHVNRERIRVRFLPVEKISCDKMICKPRQGPLSVGMVVLRLLILFGRWQYFISGWQFSLI